MKSSFLPPASITNPVTGDICWLLQQAASENGNVSRIRFEIAAHAAGSPRHYHSRLSETFSVESGTLHLAIGGSRKSEIIHPMTAGQSLCIAPGTPHRFWNATGERVTFVAEVSPGNGFEKFILALYGLAREGNVSPAGAPKSLLAWACLMDWADFRVVGVPLGLQYALVAFLLKRAERHKVAGALRRAVTACHPE